jgi:hypothetical protein
MQNWIKFKPMFDSQYFSSDMKIFYIQKFISNNEAVEYLLNLLSKDDFLFYLP